MSKLENLDTLSLSTSSSDENPNTMNSFNSANVSVNLERTDNQIRVSDGNQNHSYLLDSNVSFKENDGNLEVGEFSLSGNIKGKTVFQYNKPLQVSFINNNTLKIVGSVDIDSGFAPSTPQKEFFIGTNSEGKLGVVISISNGKMTVSQKVIA